MGGKLKFLASNHSMVNIDYDDITINDSNFSNAKLTCCIFGSRTIFQTANFTGAFLENCKFRSTFLAGDFRFSSWDTIDAQNSVFEDCLFFNVDFKNCNLRRIHFRGCTFHGCSFINCDLNKTHFSCSSSIVATNFVCCDLDQVHLPDIFVPFAVTQSENAPYIPMVCPDEGSFIGYKKAWAIEDGNQYPVLITLRIPAEARRTSGFGRKCRCDKATVVKMEWLSPKEHSRQSVPMARSIFDEHFVYIKGKKVKPRNGFCTDRWDVCSAGIHFFMNKREAIDYC